MFTQGIYQETIAEDRIKWETILLGGVPEIHRLYFDHPLRAFVLSRFSFEAGRNITSAFRLHRTSDFNIMATIRIKTTLLPLLVTIVLQNSEAFGVTKNILSRTISPKVQFIPVVSSGFSLTSKKWIEESSSSTSTPQRTFPVGLKLKKFVVKNGKESLNEKVAEQASRPQMTGKGLVMTLASFLATLVCRPTLAFAMGGGMGGSKGPVAPIPR